MERPVEKPPQSRDGGFMERLRADPKNQDLPAEQEITESWTSLHPPVVSVCCVAYNQRAYIPDAIRGVVRQKTSFPFEIIIRDDGSTDGTRSIVEDFADAYPRLIKPILLEENTYSNGVLPMLAAFEHAGGRYLAPCDGDDFWIDSGRLQVMVEAMESSPDIDLACHNAFAFEDGSLSSIPRWPRRGTGVFSTQEVLECGGSFAPTCSYLLRRRLLENLPEWVVTDAPVDDFFQEIFGSMRGGALYIDEPMAAVRLNTAGSWTARMKSDQEHYLDFHIRMVRCLELLEEEHPELRQPLRERRAKHLLDLAKRKLASREDAEFRRYITQSVSCHRFLSPKQRQAYLYRYLPPALRAVQKFRARRRRR